MTYTPNREKIELAAGALIALAVIVATYVRQRYGISVGDESYCVLLAYFPALDLKWFVNDLSIPQTAGILASPFVRAAAALQGTDGLMLATRRLHLVAAVLVAAQAYRTLRHFTTSRGVALALAAITIAFIPSGISNLTYNNLGSLFFGLATLLAVEAHVTGKRTPAVCAGAAWVISVFAYPPMIVPFAVCATAIAFKKRHTKAFALGVAAVGLPLAALLAAQGVENIRAAINWGAMLSHSGSAAKFFFAAHLAWTYVPLTALALAAAWFAASFFARATPLLIAAVAAFLAWPQNSETPAIQVLWPLLALPLAVHVARMKVSPKERHLLHLLILPALVGAFAACLASRMTLYSMCLTMVFAGLAATVLIARTRTMQWAFALTLIAGAIAGQWTSVYEDAPIEQLQYEMQDGPYKGLITTATKAEWIDKTIAAIAATNGTGKTILIKDTFPIGYLYTDKKLDGPIPYFFPAIYYVDVRPHYRELFANRELWPDVVVDLKEYPNRPDFRWPMLAPEVERYDAFYKFFQRTGAYRVTDSPTAEILIRR